MYDEYQPDPKEMKIQGQQGQQQQDNQPLPLYAQVQGEKIYMGGLDYSLLQKQKLQQSKNGLLSNIKNQLFNMQSRIDSRVVKSTPEQPIDQASIKLINSIKNLQNVKPLVNSSTYYVFDTRWEFGRLKPEVITKRLGRLNKEAAYIRVGKETIERFKGVLEKSNEVDKEKVGKDRAFKKLMGKGNGERGSESGSSDDDNIFGSDDESNHSDMVQGEENQRNGSKTDSSKLFNFGQKLSFGVKDEDIFNTKKIEPQNDDDIFAMQNEKEKEQKVEPQKDKYEFLRKKVKKTANEQGDDGYGECYIQSGPTFEQMKQSRNQGIELWGDLKEPAKRPERKTNIHKEYGMVKRIIDQKNKKK